MIQEHRELTGVAVRCHNWILEKSIRDGTNEVIRRLIGGFFKVI